MQPALGFVFFHQFLFFLSFPTLSIMVRKTRANKKTTSNSTPAFDRERIRFKKNQDIYEKLNIFRFVWVERKVILDELDLEIRRNFERRGQLPLLDISHPPLVALIRKFYSNLSAHSDDSNTHYVMSWIRGEEYTITPSVVAFAFGVPLVRQLVYPYSETPPLDDIMSYLTGTSIQWSTDSRINSHELTEIHYLFFRISCHSI